ncbi:MAG: hypothetical protein IIW19_05460, partial [Clostridia bacterium]|nr:hypothetical protein [Clostridia bacterium]
AGRLDDEEGRGNAQEAAGPSRQQPGLETNPGGACSTSMLLLLGIITERRNFVKSFLNFFEKSLAKRCKIW